MKRRHITAILVAALCLHPVVYAQNRETPDSILHALRVSFNSKDAAKMKHWLSGKFSVGVYTMPASERMLQTIVERYPVDSISLVDVSNSEDRRRITFAVTSRGETSRSDLYLNEKNEILYFDLFDRLYGVEKYRPSTLQAEIPFQLVNGAIVINARLNNSTRPLRLLFDTGADGMALRKSLADSLGLNVSRRQSTSVVGGNMEVSISSGNTLHLDTLSIPNNNIALFENIGEAYDGILGCTIATRYITKVDFDRKVIALYSFGAYEEKRGFSIETEFPAGVPMLNVGLRVGDKSVNGNFVFDSGANYYLIAFGPFVKKHLLLTSGFVPWFTGATVSMGRTSTVFTGNFSEMGSGMIKLQNFPGVLQAHSLGPGDWDVPGNGSLGIKTMRRYNFVIDLPHQEIHFTPNKNFHLPVDFMIGNMILSAIDSTTLQVSQLVKKDDAINLREGDIILSINGVKARDLVWQPAKRKQLQAAGKKPNQIRLLRNGEQHTVTN